MQRGARTAKIIVDKAACLTTSGPPIEQLALGTMVYIEDTDVTEDVAKCFYLLPDGRRIDLIIACEYLKEIHFSSDAKD